MELIQGVQAFIKKRAPQVYAIVSDIIRILAESKQERFFKPATAKNSYANVKADIRGGYSLQARELYDEICLKVSRAILNNIRVSFKGHLRVHLFTTTRPRLTTTDHDLVVVSRGRVEFWNLVVVRFLVKTTTTTR